MVLAVVWIILSLNAIPAVSGFCPPFRLDQHDRVARGKRMWVTIVIKDDVSLVTWHTPGLPCFGDQMVLAECRMVDKDMTCNTEEPGYNAKLVQTRLRSPDNATSQANALALGASSEPDTILRNDSDSVAGPFDLYLTILEADARLESQGSSVTYRTGDGRDVTLRAFKPHMVYTPVQRPFHRCKAVMFGNRQFSYHEIVTNSVVPNMECILFKNGKESREYEGEEIRFHYHYSFIRDTASRYTQSGICSVLLHREPRNPDSDQDWEHQQQQQQQEQQQQSLELRVRTKTREIYSGVPPYMGGVKSRGVRNLDLPWEESIQIGEHSLAIPGPRQQFISYHDRDDGSEPDQWHAFRYDVENCFRETNTTNDTVTTKAPSVTKISGLVTLDQNSCPLYLADGSVAACRCFVTERGRGWRGLTVSWKHFQITYARLMDEGPRQSVLLVYKYTGTSPLFSCVAEDQDNNTIETVYYKPRDIEHRVFEASEEMRGKVMVALIAAISNLMVFIGACGHTMLTKNSALYREEISEAVAPYKFIRQRTARTTVKKIPNE